MAVLVNGTRHVSSALRVGYNLVSLVLVCVGAQKQDGTRFVGTWQRLGYLSLFLWLL